MATKLRHYLRQAGMTRDADASYLLTLLSLPEGTAPLAGLNPEARKARTLAILRHMSLHCRQGGARVIAMAFIRCLIRWSPCCAAGGRCPIGR